MDMQVEQAAQKITAIRVSVSLIDRRLNRVLGDETCPIAPDYRTLEFIRLSINEIREANDDLWDAVTKYHATRRRDMVTVIYGHAWRLETLLRHLHDDAMLAGCAVCAAALEPTTDYAHEISGAARELWAILFPPDL